MNETAANFADLPEILFLVAVVVVFIVLVIRNAKQGMDGLSRRRSLRPAMQQVRDYYNGEFAPGPLYELPRLRFAHQGATVLLEPNPGGRASPRPPYHVSIRFVWPNSQLRMEVYPEQPVTQALKLIGIQDIVIGNAAFDRRYMITGNNLTGIRKLLTQRVCDLINLIRGPKRRDDVHVRIVGGHLWVTKRNLCGDPRELMDFVQLTLALYDALLAQPAAGIEFLEATINRSDAPICQVCGETIDTPEVQCARCFTPHHQECWTYFGGCSIYGCRSKESEPARTITRD